MEENKNNDIVAMDPNQSPTQRKYGFMGQTTSDEELKKLFGFKSMENKQTGTFFGML